MVEYITQKEIDLVKKALDLAKVEPNIVEAFIVDYERYRYGEIARYELLSSRFISEIGDAKMRSELSKTIKPHNKTIPTILDSYFRYIDYKTKMIETYQETNNWYSVLSNHVYRDSEGANESFIDYVEEVYQTQIKDAKHLQELTGITELDTWDSKSGKYVDPKTEEEAKQNAIKELQDILITARESKYTRAMESALQGGATYKDLLKISPKDYGLPSTWLRYGSKEYDQHKAILEVIGMEYLLDEPGGLMMIPGLRAIAEDLGAPYSVVIESYNKANYIRRL